MLIRSLFVAALAAFGATLSAEPDLANRAADNAAALEQEAPASAARVRPGQTTRPPVVVGPGVLEATTSFSCREDNGSTTIYTLSMEGGRCEPNGTANNKPTGATCRNSGSREVVATASCASGCGTSTGSGSCTQTTQH